MIKRSPMLIDWFARYTSWYLRRNFNAVRCSRDGPPPRLTNGKPAIVYLNHPSWWDPLICVLLATRFWPERKHFAPVDAAALRRYPLLSRLGFFGIERSGRRGAAEFLRVGAEIARQSNTIIWITPEGNFMDARRRDRSLRPGFLHLAQHSPDTAVIPLAIEYCFWHERRPEALCRFGAPTELLMPAAESALRTAQDALATEAMAQRAAAFDTLLSGKGGVQPLYDAWRRAAAFIRREPFSAKHEQESA